VNPVFIHLGCKLALAICLAGVLFRKRTAECRMFAVYLAVVLFCESAVAIWHEQLFVKSVWIVQQWIYDFCKFGIALELARRAFMAFPGARATARALFLAILTLTAISIFAATPAGTHGSSSFYLTVLLTIEPRLLNATIWLFVATARLVIFFNIPVSDWHRKISLGFAGYLVVFVTGLNLLRSFGLNLHPAISLLDGSAYLTLCSFWAWSAWQPAEATEVVPASVRRLAAAHA
jgi:hypothetical protein